jgi:PAS domain S-box-containing protein
VELSGYTPEEIVGRPIWDFISEESKPVAKSNLEKRHRDVNESYELKLMRKEGSSIWAFLNSKSLIGKDGKFMGSISMLADITKRKAAEQALANVEIARKKEIHHRIMNNLQVISSLLYLQADIFKILKTSILKSLRVLDFSLLLLL